MTRPRLTSLKSRLQPMPARAVKVLETTPGATPRIQGRPWEEIRQRVLKAHDYLCVRCAQSKFPRMAQEVDHIVPLEQGGSNDDSNLQPLCAPHHAEKTAQEARERHRGWGRRWGGGSASS